MILKKFKKYSEKLLEPVSFRLKNAGFEPNHITLLGLMLSILSGFFYYKGHFSTAGIILILAGVCDLVDGNMARITESTTDFGAFLDSTIDRYSDLALFAGIMGYSFESGNKLLFWTTVFALVGSLMVSYTRARAECIIERCDVGIMERPERVVILIIASLFGFLLTGLFIIGLFSNITALQRIYHTYTTLRKK